MREQIRRAIVGAALAVGLAAAVILVLAFVDMTAEGEHSTRCALTIWKSQWPKYVACTMGAVQDLASGLIGAAGVIWAAWLAYSGVRMQVSAERRLHVQERREEQERVRNREATAKEVVAVCILPAICAAAVAMAIVDRAAVLPLGGKAAVLPLGGEDVKKAFEHLRAMLDSFGLRESVREMAPDDRVRCLEIIGLLFNLISVHDYGHGKYKARMQALLSGFAKAYDLLKSCDLKLAREFAAVSRVVPPPEGELKRCE